MIHHDDRGFGHIMRTGPYIPPVTFPPFSVVVTQAVKDALEDSALSGYVLKPVSKSHIVRVDWRTWDLDADSPRYYPPGGEPENYICDQPHCRKTANIMPDLWELAGTPFGHVTRLEGKARWTNPIEPAIDFLKPNDPGWKTLVISDAAKDFLAEISDDSIEFERNEKLEIPG